MTFLYTVVSLCHASLLHRCFLARHIIHSLWEGVHDVMNQRTSRMTIISENEMNIPIKNIPLCNFWHLNGILKISLEIVPTKTQSRTQTPQALWPVVSHLERLWEHQILLPQDFCSKTIETITEQPIKKFEFFLCPQSLSWCPTTDQRD